MARTKKKKAYSYVLRDHYEKTSYTVSLYGAEEFAEVNVPADTYRCMIGESWYRPDGAPFFFMTLCEIFSELFPLLQEKGLEAIKPKLLTSTPPRN